MPRCPSCKQEADELVVLTVDGKKRRLCEECADQLSEQAAIAEQSEAVVQRIMGFQGRR